jgi:hypothetical protein
MQIKRPQLIQPRHYEVVREAERLLETENSEVSRVEGGADTLAREVTVNNAGSSK